MKQFINILMLTVALSTVTNLEAQQKASSISFDNLSHDFGDIKEEAGIANHDFIFTNTGSQPLIINRVTASCGCTTPSWTKEPVLPGGKGHIKIAYNPKNRPNKFNKSATVYSNADKNVVSLRITGNVIPKPRTIEDDFPFVIGDLRFNTNHMAFVKVFKAQKKTVSVQVLNTSDKDQAITFDMVPKHLQLTASPQILKPNQKGTIQGSYDANLVNDWGFVVNRVMIVCNENKDRKNQLTISATITEDFASLTEKEIADAPIIEFDEKVFNFGKMQQKTSVEHDFIFTNTGKSDLEIRKIKSSCGCTAVSPKEKIIKAGQTSSIKAIFSSGTRVGRQNKSITVITNDPKLSTVVLRVTGEVEAPAGN